MVFFVAVGAVGLFYLVVAAPFVTQDLVKWRKQSDRLQNDALWRATVTFLAQECYVVICLKLMSPLLCDYDTSGGGAGDYSATAARMNSASSACGSVSAA